MKRQNIIVIAVLLVVGVGAYLLWPKSEPSPRVQEQNQTTGIRQEGGESFHPVSLPAMMQKQFDGRDFRVGQVLADNEAYTRYYITYKSGELTISGIMNVPKGRGPFPVLFLNHGYIDPAVYTNGRGLRREQDYLARRGYVVIHSDYRNHASSSKDPDTDYNFRLGYVEDVVNAVYAVRNSDLPYFNKEKIGMLGHSMGGGVTINILVVQPELIDAAVLFAPVSADYADNFERWLRSRPEVAERILQDHGSPQSNPDFWHDISAINFTDRIFAPVLLHHGTADESVPVEWSDRYEAALKEKGKEITYHKYPGQPHEFTTDWGLVMQRTVEFYDRLLKN